MPLYMDVHHHLPEGATADDVADAHRADVATQGQYGVQYLRYWVDEGSGKVFCLVEAPDAETANTVHREAHGLVADEILQVSEGA
jgi:Nickel responsive protein SCO4226-like